MKRVLAVVGLCLAAGYLVLNTSNHLMGRALLVALGDVESTYRSAMVSWNGDITARDLTVYLYDAEEVGPPGDIRFAEVRLETPGLHWVLFQSFRNIKLGRFDKRTRGSTPHLDSVRLNFTGIESDYGDEPTLGFLGPVGPVSASPFEAEGCAEDAFWARDELAQMGLTPGPTTLHMVFEVEGTRLKSTHTLATPGVGEVRYERSENLPAGEHNALLLDFIAGAQTDAHYAFRDDGFIGARNAWCARQARITQETFVARHLISVERLLGALGVGLDPSALAAYRRFASAGGALNLSFSFNPPVSTDYEDVHDRAQALLHAASSRIDTGGEPARVQLTRFEPRPLEGLESGLSTWAAIEAEQREESRLQERLERPPGSLAQAALPAPEAADPVAPTLDSIAASTHPNGPIRTLAERRSVRIGEDIRRTLTWQDLSDYVGEPLRVTTRQGGRRVVELLKLDRDRLHVRARLSGGTANFSIQRASISLIETTPSTRKAASRG